MITHADVSISANGDALIMVPPAGFDPNRKVALSFPDGFLVLSQNERDMVRIKDPKSKEDLLKAAEITVLEVGNDGYMTLHLGVEVDRS